jgi:hypothetical protein
MGFTYGKVALNTSEKHDICTSIVVVNIADTGKKSVISPLPFRDYRLTKSLYFYIEVIPFPLQMHILWDKDYVSFYIEFVEFTS